MTDGTQATDQKKKKKKQRNQLPSLQENDPNIRKAPQILARRKRIGQKWIKAATARRAATKSHRTTNTRDTTLENYRDGGEGTRREGVVKSILLVLHLNRRFKCCKKYTKWLFGS